MKLKKEISRLKRNTLISYILSLLIMFSFTYSFLLNNRKMEFQNYQDLEYQSVNIQQAYVQEELFHISNDLLALSVNEDIEAFLSDRNDIESYEKIGRYFMNIANYRRLYDQVRLIDDNGMELTRVNFNNGEPKLVAQSKLQNKKGRYYFDEAIKLNSKEIYFSPLDLNIENGKIEQPLKPMIRIATPVFNSMGEKSGIVIINAFGNNITKKILSQENPMINNQMMLLNEEGYYLRHLSPEKEWGFMYEEKKDKSFINDFPDVWTEIKETEYGQIKSKDGLFSFKSIYPIERDSLYFFHEGKIRPLDSINYYPDDYFWKIVSYVPERELFEKHEARVRISILIIALLTVIASIIALSYYKTRVQQIRARIELSRLNANKDKFFSIISHDLRSPMASLTQIVQLLINKFDVMDEKKIKDFLIHTNDLSEQISHLLENLLDWSKLQRKAKIVKKEVVEIDVLISESIILLRDLADKKNIQIKDKSLKEQKTYADKSMISSVFRNLLSNAIKFTPSDGEITIRSTIQENKKYLMVNVQDSGVGMSPEQIEDLYKIEKSQTTKGTEGEVGSGLGLILTKDFIEGNGGKLLIESEVNKGSTFSFTIPLFIAES